MLDEDTRTAILRLHARRPRQPQDRRAPWGSRATRCGASSAPAAPPCRRCCARNSPNPGASRSWSCYARYEGHLGRVHDALTELRRRRLVSGVDRVLPPPRHRHAPPPPAGHYLFAAGQEMQHDTSPHYAQIGGNLTRVQTASLVLCYSRMIFFQHYPRFTRFECKAFLAAGHRLLPGLGRPLHGGQLQRRGRLRYRGQHDPGAGDGRLRGALRLCLRRPREGRCEPLGAGRGAVPAHRERLPGRRDVRRLVGLERDARGPRARPGTPSTPRSCMPAAGSSSPPNRRT